MGKWCFLPYDFDTAIGINNEGSLVFSYELEDIDKVAGADVFNGQNSVLWVNLRQAYADEIKAMYQDLRSKGKLSYEATERQFEEHQEKWPEAIFNEDAYFKYLQPLIDDNSAAYLSMLQGSKAEQRKWWLYNRYRYLDSKYNAGDALSDVITVRGYAKADITVTPYADIYASVKYGSYLVQQRALRGSSYTLECPLDNVNDTEIYIYSASQLKDVGDLSGLMVGYAEFSLATKLQSLKLGDAADSYSNTNLTDLHLGNNVLLRTLDVRNCPNLVQAVDISGCSNVEHVYFDGTGITGINLPVGGILKTLHLPATVTNLTIRNQASLTDLSIPSYTGISTLRLENVSTAVDSRAILQAIPANSRVRLIGINWDAGTADTLMKIIALLDTMRGLDENGNNTDTAQISGTIHVDTVTGAQVAEIQSKYPDLKIAFEHITSNLYFYNYDGSVLLYTQAIVDGADGTYSGSTPSKPSTAQYTYTFAGWSKKVGGIADSEALKAVTADRNVYAVFTAVTRKYTVRFYNGSTLLQTVSNVAYGGSATYTGDTPVSSEGSVEDYPFEGWQPTGKNITGDTNCYAQFGSPLEVKEITDTWDAIIANIDNGTYKSKYKIGNYKPLDLGAEGVINMQIAAFDKDELAYGGDKAPISFVSKELLKTSHRMNPPTVQLEDGTYQEGTGAIGGWGKCELRTYLKENISPLIPDTIKNRIAGVRKNSSQYDNSSSVYITIDDLWIPSIFEVCNSPVYYKELFPDQASQAKHKANMQENVGWWTRTPYGKNQWYYISPKGGNGTSMSRFEEGICLGFCLRGPREIIDTWEEIFAAEEDGSYLTKYQISDYKPLDLGSEGIINMQIAGFDVDDLADGSGKAHITWIGRELFNNMRYINSNIKENPDGTYIEGTGSIGGWEKSEMRTYLKDSVKPLIPNVLRDNIVEVTKTHPAYDIQGMQFIQTTVDDMWIPSSAEVYESPCLYRMLFQKDENRIKARSDSETGSEWWLRSAGYEYRYYRIITESGSHANSTPNANCGTALGFCT